MSAVVAISLDNSILHEKNGPASNCRPIVFTSHLRKTQEIKLKIGMPRRFVECASSWLIQCLSMVKINSEMALCRVLKEDLAQ